MKPLLLFLLTLTALACGGGSSSPSPEPLADGSQHPAGDHAPLAEPKPTSPPEGDHPEGNNRTPSPNEEGVYRYVVGGAITAPRVIDRGGELDLSQFAGRQMKGGAVIVQLVVETDGTVGEVELLRGVAPDIDEVVLEHARGHLFEPATLDGEPVAVEYVLMLRIELLR